MVKIDGSKVKALRESQELTQLYVATAVGVTTDTISRWENKRYPTIKKKNCLKLAEALGVDFHEILDLDDSTSQDDPDIELKKTQETNAVENKKHPAIENDITSEPETRNQSLLSGILIASIFFIAAVFSFIALKSCQKGTITAIRHCPEHFIPNLPLPVVIEIDNHEMSDPAYVVTETFSKQSEVLSTFPTISANKIKGNTIKWLKKNKENNRFVYALKTRETDKQIKFRGTVSSPDKPDSILISGTLLTSPGVFHWADTNKDNRISDEEILAAYNMYNSVPSIDFNTLEEMWMGNSYRWDKQKEAIIIY